MNSHASWSSDTQLILPLHWFEQLRGALYFSGKSLPAGNDDAVLLLKNYASSVVENSLLFELAAIDVVTGVLTRAFMLQRFNESLKTAFRQCHDLTVLMLDLDHFKEVNDTHGHLAGDLALQTVGKVLRETLRDTDVVGRFGGDEFLLLLPDTTLAGGLNVARRVQQALAELRVPVCEGGLTIAASIGVGGICYDQFTADHGAHRVNRDFFQQALEMIIEQTDGLMFRAKHGPVPHLAYAQPLAWDSLRRLHTLDHDPVTPALTGRA